MSLNDIEHQEQRIPKNKNYQTYKQYIYFPKPQAIIFCSIPISLNPNSATTASEYCPSTSFSLSTSKISIAEVQARQCASFDMLKYPNHGEFTEISAEIYICFVHDLICS